MPHPQQPEITIAQIDRELAAWQQKLNVVSRNLIELDDFFTYRQLKGELDAPPALIGTTQAQVVPALASARTLWQYLQLLSDVVKRASELRGSLPRVRRTDVALLEIAQLLQGPSVVLPPLETPLAQRDLLGAAQIPQTTTPDLLLTAMTRVFAGVKNTILAVDTAWNRLEPALADAHQEVGRLQELAASMGEPELNELTAVRQRVAELSRTIANDPLGADAGFDREVSPLLQRTRQRLEELARQRAQTQADLNRAPLLLQSLREAHEQCRAALTQCRQKIAGTQALRAPLEESAIIDLERWLATLNATAEQGHWKAVGVGLSHWLPAANAYLDAERAALAANQFPLDAILDLRGRLAAFQAKAQSLQARGQILDAALPDIAGQAEACLHAYPVVVAEAARLVGEYEKRLNRK